MKIDELKNFIKTLCISDDHIPVMLWSAPGVGKSQAIRQVTSELEIGFIDLRLSLLNPVDLRGLPFVNREKHKAEWIEPDFLPNGNHQKSGILFLDEINLAPMSVMAAGYQLILDRRLGSYELPKGWKVVAAGNRAEDNASVTKFPSPLANRFVHVDVEADHEVWDRWAMKSGIAEEVLSFLGKMPQHLIAKPKAGDRAFPSPRSWEQASKLHKLGFSINHAVGDGVASEFNAFIKVYKRLPDVNKILKGEKEKCPKTEELDILWALSTALVSKAKPEQIGNVMKYIQGFPRDFQVRTIIGLVDRSEKHHIALKDSKEWVNWINENKDVFMNKQRIFGDEGVA